MVKGIVCDVGHVIAHGSILNRVLNRLGMPYVATRLYDLNEFYALDKIAFERSVESKMVDKMQVLRAISPDIISSVFRAIEMTEGFSRFVDLAREKQIAFTLIGAVPDVYIRMLLKVWSFDVSSINIMASKYVENGFAVLTPSMKRESTLRWLADHAISPDEALYIGDSVGDLDAMACLPKSGRVAFNSTSGLVRAFCGHHFDGSFGGLIDLIAMDDAGGLGRDE